MHPEDEFALDVRDVDIDHLAVDESRDFTARRVDDERPEQTLVIHPGANGAGRGRPFVGVRLAWKGGLVGHPIQTFIVPSLSIL